MTSSPDSTVSPAQWRLALLLALFVLIGLCTLVIVLMLGLADPPRAGDLRWESRNPQAWSTLEAQIFTAPIRLTKRPFTLEITASNGTAWGIWLDVDGGRWRALISNDGYVSVGTTRDWFEFLHVRRFTANTLYLHVERDGTATLRVNDEIAWTGFLDASGDWGIEQDAEADVGWLSIKLYEP